MSVLLALTLMAAAADPAPEGAPATPPVLVDETDVLVMARKLDEVKLSIRRDGDGRLQCSATESTGLPKLDAQLCRATLDCIDKGGWTEKLVRQCVQERRPALIEAMRQQLLERREREIAQNDGDGA